MKKINPFPMAVSALLLVFGCGLDAAPAANSNMGREYLIGSSGLEPWSAGLYVSTGSRRLEWAKSRIDTDMDFVKSGLTLGYDLLRWATPYFSVSANKVKLDYSDADESTVELGFGLQLNLLDQEIMDSGIMEDRLRVNANVFYGLNTIDWDGRTVEWQELSASLTGSIVNDLTGNKAYVPESIALYAGPAYSTYISDDFDVEQEWGMVGGLRVFVTKRISLDLSIEKFKLETYTGSLNIRF